jgi:electron-transferring-flavoprotein dehydrogenase
LSVPEVEREAMAFDVVIVGAGPAGLAAACRLGQLAAERGSELAVAVVEKGADVGAHVMSGAVIDPRGLAELYPDWQALGAPLRVAVSRDEFHWLASARAGVTIPRPLVPGILRNEGNYVASLGELSRWLAQRAEAQGCNIFPGFAAVEVLYDGHGAVRGVATGDMGVAGDGRHKPGFERGVELTARYVVFAEGCRGSLGKGLEHRFDLRTGTDPQHYGIGFKEIWTIDAARHRPGTVTHTFGWPLDNHTEGGGFLYHADEQRAYVGFVVALNYSNPHLDPFCEFQRWKQHPRIRAVLEGGTRLSYGARAVNKGGLQSLPKLAFPGGLLVGCEAGFLNGAKIKGTHTAIKSGMLAAESIFAALGDAPSASSSELESYAASVRASWLWEELHQARNFSPGFARFGTLAGAVLAFVEHALCRSRFPFTLHNTVPDHAGLRRADQAEPIEYPRPDGVISFDRASSVFLSNTHHEEDQPCHLKLADPALPISRNLPLFDEPAQRYCPAGVYEVVRDAAGAARFQINAANCVHCKTCDIKDPAQNITWVPPEGGGGPRYTAM